jgi:S-adenosylmethionine:tRNA ribosyltransferase-isomerase
MPPDPTSPTGVPQPLAHYDYELPEALIAQAPARPRDASRLMVLPRREGAATHRSFAELPGLLAPGDLLVVNRTQVVPARLRLTRETGGKAELLLTRPVDGEVESATTWSALGRPGRHLVPGRRLRAADGSWLTVVERHEDEVVVRGEGTLWPLLERHGEVPLPPYIRREGGPSGADAADYQTLFARERGAVAAPTASLHFTPAVVAALAARGVALAELVLHVGPGTFLPVREEHEADVRAHPMHEERYHVPAATLEALAAARARGGRVIGVGTTSVRALETWRITGESAGASRLFIYPGFEFKVIDGMVTNFHLPRSTLLMLVAAFAGRERVLAAYAEAVRERYRFFSYGDAMLIL